MRREDSLIEMKVTPKNSNPANNEVIQGTNDTVLQNYLREISAYAQLTQEEETELAKRIEQGDLEAKQKLIQANLKLVITIARKAIHMSSLPIVDLIQEGNMGLMIAAEKFNYKLGYRFSTYASWWIKQAMFKAISEQSYSMKIPVYVQETLSKYRKVKSDLEKKYNCEIQKSVVAKKMNIEENEIINIINNRIKKLS